MTKFVGQLHKMAVKHSDPVEYGLVLHANGTAITGLPAVNDFLGKTLTLHFTGNISCIGCQRKIPKTYNQGYCFPCVQKLAACDMCIVKPHNCHYEHGTCREPEWGLANCFIPHIVYLANSSGIKVGVTKEKNVTTRWIDQGAVQSVPILRVQSRLQAGLLESAIAELVNDKTDWRKMLRGANDTHDLAAKRNELFAELATTIQNIAAKFTFGAIELLTSEPINNFNYPVLEYPQKITSLCFEKNPTINDTLLGIKGQYLIFASGVINIRKYTGYEISVEL